MMNITSGKQWIIETTKARDALIEKHGFNPELFVTVGDGLVAHIPHHDYYPDEWESDPAYEKMVRVKELVKQDCIPDGLALFEMPESQCNCSGCSSAEQATAIYMDPIMMLERIVDWDKNNKGKF